MVWNVGSDESRQMAVSDPSLEYYTRGALGLSVWDVVQIALGTMAVSCVIFGTVLGWCLAKLFGTHGTQGVTVQARIPEGSEEKLCFDAWAQTEGPEEKPCLDAGAQTDPPPPVEEPPTYGELLESAGLRMGPLPEPRTAGARLADAVSDAFVERYADDLYEPPHVYAHDLVRSNVYENLPPHVGVPERPFPIPENENEEEIPDHASVSEISDTGVSEGASTTAFPGEQGFRPPEPPFRMPRCKVPEYMWKTEWGSHWHFDEHCPEGLGQASNVQNNRRYRVCLHCVRRYRLAVLLESGATFMYGD